jgi:hypothetical protein
MRTERSQETLNPPLRYPECEGRETEMLNNAGKIYYEEAMIASDGMKVVV